MTPSDSVIRPATAGDIDDLVKLQSGYADAWTASQIGDALHNDSARLLVAERSGETVAYSAGYLVLEDVELAQLWVHPGHRSLGVARKLIVALVSQAQGEGCRRMLLEVRVGNVAAINLYRSMGFEQLSIRPHYYRHPEEDALVLERVF